MGGWIPQPPLAWLCCKERRETPNVHLASAWIYVLGVCGTRQEPVLGLNDKENWQKWPEVLKSNKLQKLQGFLLHYVDHTYVSNHSFVKYKLKLSKCLYWSCCQELLVIGQKKKVWEFGLTGSMIIPDFDSGAGTELLLWRPPVVSAKLTWPQTMEASEVSEFRDWRGGCRPCFRSCCYGPVPPDFSFFLFFSGEVGNPNFYVKSYF